VSPSDQFPVSLVKYLPIFGLSLTEQQIEQCSQHYEMLLKWNRKIALTTIIDPDEAARFHYCESMFAYRFLPETTDIVDLGSGAGFPGIPLAFMNPDRAVKLVESNGKKAIFLKECVRGLDLKNTTVVTNRFQNLDLTGLVWATRAIETLEGILKDLFASPQPSSLVIFTTDAVREKMADADLSAWNIMFEPIPKSKNRQLLLANRV